jgi:hypothetical protein
VVKLRADFDPVSSPDRQRRPRSFALVFEIMRARRQLRERWMRSSSAAALSIDSHGANDHRVTAESTEQ